VALASAWLLAPVGIVILTASLLVPLPDTNPLAENVPVYTSLAPTTPVEVKVVLPLALLVAAGLVVDVGLTNWSFALLQPTASGSKAISNSFFMVILFETKLFSH
jgi:hypothetical protein